MTIGMILLIAALICFLLAAFGFGYGRLNLIAAGLACCVASILAGSSLIG
jgi:hypothetical protein